MTGDGPRRKAAIHIARGRPCCSNDGIAARGFIEMNPIAFMRVAWVRIAERLRSARVRLEARERQMTPAEHADGMLIHAAGLLFFVPFDRFAIGAGLAGAEILLVVGILAWAAVVFVILSEIEAEPTAIVDGDIWLNVSALVIVCCWFFPLNTLIVVTAWAIFEMMLAFRRHHRRSRSA